MSIITVKDLHKTYTPNTIPVHALQGVSLQIGEGEFTAIVGPSGSGKSTLLNMIGGLDTPTEGSVIVAGTDLATLSPRKLIRFRLENIGFVFQDYSLLPVFTAKENVEFIMQLQDQPKQAYAARAIELLEAVGLADAMHRRPGKLSGGQQQRVAVARALASKPRFVLADEPTANLDSHSTADLLDLMEQLNRQSNTTFVFSTHDQRVIDRARRVITITDGQVESDLIQRTENTAKA